jgi:hypothetical protein
MSRASDDVVRATVITASVEGLRVEAAVRALARGSATGDICDIATQYACGGWSKYQVTSILIVNASAMVAQMIEEAHKQRWRRTWRCGCRIL